MNKTHSVNSEMIDGFSFVYLEYTTSCMGIGLMNKFSYDSRFHLIVIQLLALGCDAKMVSRKRFFDLAEHVWSSPNPNTEYSNIVRNYPIEVKQFYICETLRFDKHYWYQLHIKSDSRLIKSSRKHPTSD